MTVASIVSGKVAALRASGNEEVRTVKPDIAMAIRRMPMPTAYSRDALEHVVTAVETRNARRQNALRSGWRRRQVPAAPV